MKKVGLLFFATFFIHLPFIFSFFPSYDETSYAFVAEKIARGQETLLYGSKDIYFFPPLFNYAGAFFNWLGFERIISVRIVSLIFSSGISPLLYLLIKKSGSTQKTAYIAVLLWLISPYVTYLSVLGMVETMMIFFILAAAYTLQLYLSNKERKFIIASALLLGFSIWTKETAVGFIPVFLFFFLKEIRSGLLWGSTLFLSISPLLFESISNTSQFGLFYEINVDSIFFAMNPDIMLLFLANVIGITTFPKPGFALVFNYIAIFTIFLSLFSLNLERIKTSFFLKFSILTISIFIPFFTVFPKKHAYYLVLVYLFLLFPLAEYLSRKKIFTLFFAIFITFFSMQTLPFLRDSNLYKDMESALRLTEKLSPGSKIAMALPRMAQHIVIKEHFNLQIYDLPDKILNENSPFFRKPGKAILEADYYLGEHFFLSESFCDSWPGLSRNGAKCDFEALKQTVKHFEEVDTFKAAQILYKIKKETADNS